MTRPLKDFIPIFIQKHNDWKIKLAQNWESIIGPLSAQVTLEKIDKDIAILGVYDSCWMQELYLLSPLLLKTINTTLDQPYIKQLRFKKAAHNQPQKKPQATVYTPKPVVLTYTEEHALQVVDDPSLRLVLKKFLIRCYQENINHEKKIVPYVMLTLLMCQTALKPNLHEYMWANYQQFAGNMTQAGKLYQELFAQKPSIYCYKGYIHYLDKMHKVKEIVSLAATINDTFKQDPDVQLILVNALKKDNQKLQAHKQLLQAYNTFPSHMHIVFETASMYIDKKELASALQVIDKLLNNVSSQPNFFIFHFMKAQLYVQLNQLENALDSVKKSLEMHNAFDQGWLMRATIEETLGNINNAIAGYSNFLKLSQQPNQQIAHHLMQLSLKQKTVQANQFSQETEQTGLEKATPLSQQHKYTQALDAIEAYLTQQPQNMKARLIKIQLLTDMRQFNRAITELQAWIYENPAEELWFEALHLLAQLGAELPHVIKTFESLHAQYPQNTWGLLYLTDLYLRTKNHKKAITLLEKSLQHVPDKNLRTKIFFQLGLLYFEQREYQKMQTVLEQGQMLGANFLPLMNLLAHHYATKGNDLPKAETLMRQILALNNTDPHLLDTHALILYKKKQYPQALTLLQRIQADVPHDATIMIHLALTYHKLGNTDAAHTALRKAQPMAKSAYEKNKIAKLTQQWALS